MSRILVIDDDSGHRLILKSRLTDGGHEVVIVDSGARGLAEARNSIFDIFLVAARLGSGGVDGYEVCKRLKAIPQLNHTPVVLFNDQSGTHDEVSRGFEAGCDAFVSKSELPALEHVLRVALRQKRRLDEVAEQLRSLQEQVKRRNEAGGDERARAGHEHEITAHNAGDAAAALREIASGRPDGVLIVDAEGTVRYADRGASELLGSRIEGMHLGNIAPSTGLEAFVRDARIEVREGLRFDIPARKSRAARTVVAVAVPLLLKANSDGVSLRVVLLNDAHKRRIAAELLRAQEPGIPRQELGPLLDAAREVYRPAALIGNSPAANALRASVARLIDNSDTVLIHGGEGSGKERLARILHYSGTSTGSFLQIRCSAQIPEHLEVELFGQAKVGNANALDRPGLFHLAQDGTLLLEEIGELALELQERLVRFLDTHMIQRKGASKPERIELRLIASTSHPLETMAREGRFSKELLERLSKTTLEVAPLSARREDIDLLVSHFILRFGSRGDVREIDEDALQLLRRYDWPHNLAELEDAIDQACARAESGRIRVEDLPRALRETLAGGKDVIPSRPPSQRPAVGGTHVVDLNQHELTPQPRSGPFNREPRAWDITDDDPINLDLYEKKALLRALDYVGGDKLKAAKLLKVGKSTLYRKLKRFNIK